MTEQIDPWRSVVKPSRSYHVDIRGRRYRIREWGAPAAPPLLLLHGGRDVSATFQFLIDAMAEDWRFVAPDWRGHGESDWTPGEYWLSDFLVDLDALVDLLFPGLTLPVIGHSMGANIAGLYAGLRPERVSRLVLLDALGSMLDLSPAPIVDTLLRMLRTARPAAAARLYPTLDDMAVRLRAANPRLNAEQAAFMADHLARPAFGGFRWAKDPAFHRSLPTLHDDVEWGACWERITAAVLCLFSSDPRDQALTGDPLRVAARAAYFQDIALATMLGTGHNVHHDAPQAVARMVDDFLTGDDRLGPEAPMTACGNSRWTPAQGQPYEGHKKTT